MKYKWAKILRKTKRNELIFLKEATVTSHRTIDNFVTVSGLQKIQKEWRYHSRMPKSTRKEPLHFLDPRRLFGIKTTTIETVIVGDGWEEDWVASAIGNERVFVKYEWEVRSYRVSSTWLELSDEVKITDGD